MHSHTEVVSIVNEVIETLNERVEGYLRAADHIKDPTIESILREYSMQSRGFIEELQPFSDKSSEQIGKGPLGTIYQGWMNLKEAVTGYNTKSILGDCVTGEEAAIKVYQGAIKDEDNPAELRSVLSKQLVEISSAQERVNKLKEQFD